MAIIGRLKLKAQIMCGDEAAMGPGKAMVLEAIDRTGSITAAGRDLGMSYRRIWLLVDSMNRCWDQPLVATTVGGGATTGARLTEAGRAVLADYRDVEERMVAATQGDAYLRLLARVRSRPRAPRAAKTPAES